MYVTLEEAAFRYRDHELNIPERWFSGQDWADGTAEKVLREDYRRAVLEKDPTIELLPDDLQGSLF
jgi:hypothetical protein